MQQEKLQRLYETIDYVIEESKELNEAMSPFHISGHGDKISKEIPQLVKAVRKLEKSLSIAAKKQPEGNKVLKAIDKIDAAIKQIAKITNSNSYSG